MDTASIIHELKSALSDQLALAGEGSDIAAAGAMLLTVLEPVMERSLLSMADQAVAEVQAQLPDSDVSLTMRDGQPEVTIRDAKNVGATAAMDDLHARLTLRLPEVLKSELEAAAGSAGDSVNSYVVKSLSGRKRGRGGPRQVRETFET